MTKTKKQRAGRETRTAPLRSLVRHLGKRKVLLGLGSPIPFLALGIFINRPLPRGNVSLGFALLATSLAFLAIAYRGLLPKRHRDKFTTTCIALPLMFYVAFFVKFMDTSAEDRLEEFQQYTLASDLLSSGTAQGRVQGYSSLLSLLDSEHYSDEALSTWLTNMAIEENPTVRTGATKDLDQLSLSELPHAQRREAIELSAQLLRQLTREGDVAESRRASFVEIFGVLLSGGEFQDIDLSHISLNGLTASGFQLQNTNFTHTDLRRARVEDCDLSGSRFVGGSIEASFYHCDLSKVTFRPNLFRPSSFSGSNMTNVRLENYSLAEYNYRHYPGWAGAGSFHGAILTGLVIASPKLFVVLPAEGEAPPSVTGILAGVLRHRQPADFRMGLTYGISSPKVRADNPGEFLPGLVAPIESVLALASKGDPNFREALPDLRETILQQFPEDTGKFFERQEIGIWLDTGENTLR